MNKTLIASTIALTLGCVNAQADIAITNMLFDFTNYAAGGSLNDDGSGNMFSVDNFFFRTWTASQETLFMDNTGSWSGSSLMGPFNYDNEIVNMTDEQVAVGIYWNWGSGNETAILEVFDCALGVCTGNGVAMQNGPFAGSTFTFSGIGSATVIPVPSAVWLLGSGLVGLIGLARRKA